MDAVATNLALGLPGLPYPKELGGGDGVLSAPLPEFADALRLSQVSHNGMVRFVAVAGPPDMQGIDYPVPVSHASFLKERTATSRRAHEDAT